MRKLMLLSVALLGLAGGTARACDGMMIADAPALENPTAVLKPGYVFMDITQMKVARDTNMGYYCARGDYCYPVQSIKLLNCSVGKNISSKSDPDVYYSMKGK